MLETEIVVGVSPPVAHHDVIKWKHFPRYWPFVRGIHRSRWIPRTKATARSFDVFFDLRLNKRLRKQPWGWWFETLSWSLWRHRNGRRQHWIYSIESCSALKTFVTVINTPWTPICMVEPWVFQIKKKKENFECTHQILDDNKSEPPCIENHIHVQIIISWAYLCLWLSFFLDIKFK